MLMVVSSPCYQGGINHAQVPRGQQPHIAINRVHVSVHAYACASAKCQTGDYLLH